MKRLIGRWRIVKMELWDQEDIDLVEPGFIEFTDDGMGQFGFIAVRGWMDCRPREHGDAGGVEFTWQGHDEGDEVSGRGWARLTEDGSVDGRIYFHLGDDSSFRAVLAPGTSDAVVSARRR
ncbi:hypothetical protein [Phytoactinopolyspora halotolerans]|uniref:TIGR03067 domain-containing protein n=1 Tax=Phytoactinopolyspora halotolerans TaxID=1981512 RepID=A0A6L9SHH5_9ACTN|nr:hypothetical protein [Phytoactinopolyspora halotolerans]